MNGVRYLCKKHRGGRDQYFWNPGPELRARGFRIVRLSDDYAQAVEQAEEWNGKTREQRDRPGVGAAVIALRRNPRTFKAGVYVIGNVEGPVKIGSSASPATRLNDVQAGNPAPLHLLAFMYGPDLSGQAVELEVHRELHRCRLRGEWFSCSADEAVAAIARVMRRLRKEQAAHPLSENVSELSEFSRTVPSL